MFSVHFYPASWSCRVVAHGQPHQDFGPTKATVPTPLSPISDVSSPGQEPIQQPVTREPQWAQGFIKMMPENDADWNSQVASNSEVDKLFRNLTLSHLNPSKRAKLNWPDLFDECINYMVRIKSSLPLASFFSFVFIATCHIAYMDGCSESLILDAMRQCLELSSNSPYYYDNMTLEEIRKAALVAIQLLNECAGVLGYRAYEIPLHCEFSGRPVSDITRSLHCVVPTRLPIAIYCDPVTLRKIMVSLPLNQSSNTHRSSLTGFD